MSAYQAAARAIITRAGSRPPRLGMVLGSGLSSISEAIDKPVVVPYAELDGFPDAGVTGHAGQLVLG